MRGNVPASRTAATGSSRSSSWVQVGATRDRSCKPSPITATTAGPSTPGSHARPTSAARPAASGRHFAGSNQWLTLNDALRPGSLDVRHVLDPAGAVAELLGMGADAVEQ